MKIPLSPPNLPSLLRSISLRDLEAVMRQASPIVQGKYLHWDNLRHRAPPEGLSHKTWWLGMKLSRLAAGEPMPLLDEEGQPFSLVYAVPIRQALHHIDQSLGATGPSSAPPRVEGLAKAHGRRHLLASSLIRSSRLA